MTDFRNRLDNGDQIYQLAERLFPICRSITGDGVRQTLGIIQEHLPSLSIHEVPSGTCCFDWTVPKEWSVCDAWIRDPDGNKIVDFQKSNLHLVGYSIPIDKHIDLDELQSHLYSLPDQPDAIPYVTSYYKERWGFCISETQRKALMPGTYHVKIDGELRDGSLTYGELLIPGTLDKEVFLSTYICHPSMGNNEVSGITVTTFLAKWVSSMANRKYSYRFVFVPETIGSIVYLSRHLEELKARVVAGYNVTCVGDDRTYSFLPSRAENTLADRVARHVLGIIAPDYEQYSYLERGSDERQYCSPGVNLPVATVMRSKYGEYPEYHTSLDNLSVISPQGLFGGYMALARCLECLEKDCLPNLRIPCEPQLGRRGLYPDLSIKGSTSSVRDMMNLLAYADGSKSLVEIGDLIGAAAWELRSHVDTLVEQDVLELREFI